MAETEVEAKLEKKIATLQGQVNALGAKSSRLHGQLVKTNTVARARQIAVRVLLQSDQPTSGTGSTQVDEGELVVWEDADNTNTYLVYNRGGTIKKVAVT